MIRTIRTIVAECDTCSFSKVILLEPLRNVEGWSHIVYQTRESCANWMLRFNWHRIHLCPFCTKANSYVIPKEAVHPTFFNDSNPSGIPAREIPLKIVDKDSQ